MNNLLVNKKRQSRMSPNHSVDSSEGRDIPANRKRLSASREQQLYGTPKVKYLDLGGERRLTVPSKVLSPNDAKRKSTQHSEPITQTALMEEQQCSPWKPQVEKSQHPSGKSITNVDSSKKKPRDPLRTEISEDEPKLKKRYSRMSPKRSANPSSYEGVDECKRGRDQQSYIPKVKYLTFGNERRITAPSRVSAPIDAKLKSTEQLKEMSYLQQTIGHDAARPESSKMNHAEVECFNPPPSCDLRQAVMLKANPELPQTTSDSGGMENEIIKPDYLKHSTAEAETSEQIYVGDKSPHGETARMITNQNHIPYNHQEDHPSVQKVRELLDLYKDTFERLQHENKMRPRREKYIGMQINVKAAMQLKEENKWLNVNTCVGHVPGVKVGDKFQSRAEVVIVGLHSKFTAGIDYYKNVNGKLYATAIIASGRYSGDRNDSADVLIYVGEGGNPQDKFSEAKDQQLKRGNLALKNSLDKNPVRVIRSIEEPKSKDASSVNRPRYVYDGLYLVRECWSEHDPSGNLIFKFKLNRIAGQQQLLRTTHDMVRKSSKTSYGNIVVADMSEGKESMPIRVVNEYDLEKPPHFKYMTMMTWSQSCAMTFSCDSDNGFSVDGIKLQLEVFRTGSKGWGVRSRNYISAGRFVCEYIGELLQYKQEDRRIDFDESTNRNSNGSFYHDTNNDIYGNVGRFIRYHCSPNLYAKCVLFDHEDRRRPHVMLFAAKNIPPLKELTFDYKLWGQEGQKDM